MNSILTTIKKMLGIDDPSYTEFDNELIIYINSAFAKLTQIGVGPKQGFVITSEQNTWDEYVVDIVQRELVKTYIYQNVRLVFDPPSNSFLLKAIEDQIAELTWRLNVQVDPGEEV